MCKYGKIVVLFSLMLLLCASEAQAGVDAGTVQVWFSGGQREVNYVSADLNDRTYRIEAAVAHNQLGTSDDLCNIAAQLASADREVVAAINGTYFSAYDGYPVPWNTIQKQGEFIHIGNTGSVVGFTGDNRMVVDNLHINILGSTNGNWGWPDNWYAWGLNHMRDEAQAVVIFTPAYGASTGPHNKTSVVTENGVIKAIRQGQAEIPTDGYTVMVGDNTLLSRFKVGKTIDYRLDYSQLQPGTQQAGGTLDWSRIRTTLGAGPSVLVNGVVTADAQSEGFWESKVVSDRYQRSFIGVRADNTLMMGTVANVTVKELGEIAQGMNCVNAMALDSGASSSLYYQGRYLTAPGRSLSNALVLTKLKQPPVRLMINGGEVFGDADPFIREGRTLVPMRMIFESMGITPVFNAQDKSITAQRGGITLKLNINSNVAWVNNREERLEVPAMLVNGRTFVPIRFITEVFEGQAEWDERQNMVILDIR